MASRASATLPASPLPTLPPAVAAPLVAATAVTSNVTTSSIPSTRYTFTQGFFLGQISFLLICGVFIKYVVFEDSERSRNRMREREKKAHLSSNPVPPPPTEALLHKVGYDMSVQPPESSGWLNVIFAQILQSYRDDLLGSTGEEGARKQIEKWLNPTSKARQISWLDPITVTSLSLGSSYPTLSNARVRPADGHGGLRAEVDLDYTDSIHLSIATNVVINFPQPRFAILPVNLGVELVGFGGTMIMQLHPARPTMTTHERRQHMHMSLLPDFHLNVKATSLLGSRAKLQDIPKLEQIVISRLRMAIQDRYVWPRFMGLALPRLVSIGTEGVNSDASLSASHPNETKAQELPLAGTAEGTTSQSHARPPSNVPHFGGADRIQNNRGYEPRARTAHSAVLETPNPPVQRTSAILGADDPNEGWDHFQDERNLTMHGQLRRGSGHGQNGNSRGQVNGDTPMSFASGSRIALGDAQDGFRYRGAGPAPRIAVGSRVDTNPSLSVVPASPSRKLGALNAKSAVSR